MKVARNRWGWGLVKNSCDMGRTLTKEIEVSYLREVTSQQEPAVLISAFSPGPHKPEAGGLRGWRTEFEASLSYVGEPYLKQERRQRQTERNPV